ncbi:hypothetical protein ACFWIB_41100 [Streptomyces sp. NPDC127051]
MEKHADIEGKTRFYGTTDAVPMNDVESVDRSSPTGSTVLRQVKR